MEELLARDWQDLIGRVDGPLAFRLVLQPIVAAILAIRAGLQSARQGDVPYNWALLTGVGRRRALLSEGWRDLGRLIILAVVIDVIYQIIVFRWLYPIQSLIIALIVSVPSYLAFRGPTTRLVRYCSRRRTQPATGADPPHHE
jgi:hypothetical protein